MVSVSLVLSWSISPSGLLEYIVNRCVPAETDMLFKVTRPVLRLVIEPVQLVITGSSLSIFAVIVKDEIVTEPLLKTVMVGVNAGSHILEDGLLINRGCAS